MAIKITPEVMDVLAKCTVDGTVLKLPQGQLERSLYASTDKVLKALGGKWDRRIGGHVFPFDPTPKLADALSGSSVVSRQQKLQLFETPPELADRLCELVDIKESDVCLEPSAGLGRIVRAMAKYRPAEINIVEIDEDNVKGMAQQSGIVGSLVVGDFLRQNPYDMQCTVVVMNPPFAKNQDIKHVRHAFKCLVPGGRVAAIVSEHGFLGQESECVRWRDWLEETYAHVEQVPAGTFKASGTTVPTRIVVIRKTVDGEE
jgi:predicted RNA methylase